MPGNFLRSGLDTICVARFTSPMTQTSAPADYATIVRSFTDEMVANSRNATAVHDNNGNLRDMTDAEVAFCKAINAEWRRRFDRP